MLTSAEPRFCVGGLCRDGVGVEMDWEALLDKLWSFAASNPKELETKIRSCLKGHSSEGLLQAISLMITQGQHVTAKALLTEFLKSHQSADDIQRRLELILHFKKHRAPPMLSIKSKQRSKELLIKDVNDLVASGKLQAAESLLLEAIDAFEESDSLNLLSRVYMLQRRPMDGAKAMQRALLLKRQQQAFIEIEPEESTDDLPTDSDLAFISDSSEHLTTLENPAAPTHKALTETVDDSLTFIQHTASQYPSLKTDVWWERRFSR
ncbi:Tetratricopeptide repeat [Pseudomonas syringae pv. actinidiae]|uniref:Tetratricopeptide repeat n=2 Tax=Pseudomonas syringae TaxID=317 RepID=A0AAN4Q8K1_PSESF|nr:Tetratricopeptide repeat [Pseudomonas syringae pv. actinidiae]